MSKKARERIAAAMAELPETVEIIETPAPVVDTPAEVPAVVETSPAVETPKVEMICPTDAEIAQAKDILARAKAFAKTTEIKVAKSTVTGACKMVWQIADTEWIRCRDSAEQISRSKVIELCEQVGIASATAKTQYQSWKRTNGY